MENEEKQGTNWTRVLIAVVACVAVAAIIVGVAFAIAGTGRSGTGSAQGKAAVEGCQSKDGDCSGSRSGGCGMNRGASGCDRQDCEGKASGSCDGSCDGDAQGNCNGDCENSSAPAGAK